MILDPQGNVLWFLPYAVSRQLLITDFRVQTYNGQQVLTWFQGFTNHGSGVGEGVIWDRNYKQIATVNAGNGLHMDLHEFAITSGSHAWIICVSPVSLPRVPHKPVEDAVVQEIDIKTGLVMFEWHALDHVPLSDSSMSDKSPGVVDDPYHANSISFAGQQPGRVAAQHQRRVRHRPQHRQDHVDAGGQAPQLQDGLRHERPHSSTRR